MGDRAPAVFVEKDSVCIMMALSGDENYRYNHTGLVAGAWYYLDLEQVEQEGVYLFQIVVDGVTVLEVENSRPTEFEQVQVFASDPWYPPLNGKIKNFQYSTTTTKQSFSIIIANLTVDNDIETF